MIQILAQILLEESRGGAPVMAAFHAHHAGVHATEAELHAVNTFIEAMKATMALSIQIGGRRAGKNGEVLALPAPVKAKKPKKSKKQIAKLRRTTHFNAQ